MDNLSKLPERLKELMQDHDDIKSETLGKTIGVTGSTIRFILRGDTLPTLATAVKLADFFHCSLDFLAGVNDIDREVLPRELPPFYENLRKVMRECGISRWKIAHSEHFKDSYFTTWAKGQQPKLITAYHLADYMHVSLDYLVGRTDY